MGADNWKQCPNCDAKQSNNEIEAEKALADDYGKISADQYEKRRSALTDLKHTVLPDTLREDYEFYFDGDAMELNIDYSCRCETCGFNFTHHQVIPVPSAAVG